MAMMDGSLFNIAIAYGPQAWITLAGIVFLGPMVLRGMVAAALVFLPFLRPKRPMASFSTIWKLAIASVACWLVPLGNLANDRLNVMISFALFTLFLTTLTTAMVQSWLKHRVAGIVVPLGQRFETAVSPHRPLSGRESMASQPVLAARQPWSLQRLSDRPPTRADLLRWAPVAAGTTAILVTGPVMKFLGFVQVAYPGASHHVSGGMPQTGLLMVVSLSAGAIATLVAARLSRRWLKTDTKQD
jgi:hypothetical protein